MRQKSRSSRFVRQSILLRSWCATWKTTRSFFSSVNRSQKQNRTAAIKGNHVDACTRTFLPWTRLLPWYLAAWQVVTAFFTRSGDRTFKLLRSNIEEVHVKWKLTSSFLAFLPRSVSGGAVKSRNPLSVSSGISLWRQLIVFHNSI